MSNGPTAIPLKEDVDAAISSVLAPDDLRVGQSPPQSGSQVRLVLVGVRVASGGVGVAGRGILLVLVLVLLSLFLLLLLLRLFCSC